MDNLKGFCDLNIPVECSPVTTIKQVLRKAVKLGYESIAINTVIGEEHLVPTKKKGKKGDGQENGVKEIPPPSQNLLTEDDLQEFKEAGMVPKILQRLTLILTDPNCTHKFVQSENVKKYDILAVIPKNQAAFQYVCGNLEVDIISLDPEASNQFRFNRRNYYQAVERGLYFEIQYAPAIRDSTFRKNTIYNAHTLHTIGKSRNVIITSGAKTPLELRSPYDVANLGHLFGLSESQSKAALTSLCRSLALHAYTRKTGKGLISITSNEEVREPEHKKAKISVE